MRVKGTQLADLVRALRGLHKQRLVDVPPELDRYLQEKVLVSNWYPESDFRDLMLLVGRALQPSVQGSVWRLLGKQGAERDAGGVYAAWIRKDDPARTLQFVCQGWGTVRDSGRLQVTMLAPNRAELAIRAYPVMCSELAETNAGYFASMLEACGAVEVNVVVLATFEAGARFGMSWR